MDNQTSSLTNTPVENPVQPAVSTQSVTTPPSPKSLGSNKLILIVIILIILLGAGGTYLALNSKPKPTSPVSKAIPTSVSTSTVDSTTSWKNYTNEGVGWTMKYPADWYNQIGQEIILNFVVEQNNEKNIPSNAVMLSWDFISGPVADNDKFVSPVGSLKDFVANRVSAGSLAKTEEQTTLDGIPATKYVFEMDYPYYDGDPNKAEVTVVGVSILDYLKESSAFSKWCKTTGLAGITYPSNEKLACFFIIYAAPKSAQMDKTFDQILSTFRFTQ